MKFTKMNAIGNDYIYINGFEEKINNPKKLAIKMSNRNFSVGSDGLILIKPGKKVEFMMEMYNSDGSYSEMCGNGLRCVAKYLYDKKMTTYKSFQIETNNKIVPVKVFTDSSNKVNFVEINLGKPILNANKIPVLNYEGQVVNKMLKILDKDFFFTAVSIGNPHCVIFLKDLDLHDFEVKKYGPLIEKHKIFPEKVNVEFVKIISRKEVHQRTWERGSGETLACGSGAAAVLVAGVLNKIIDREISNHLLGGDLTLRWNSNNDLFLKGSAEYNFEGFFNN